jgi:hypothetical protein
MSDGDEPGDGVEDARVRELLSELRQSQPEAADLAPHVTRIVRWQRPLRHTLDGIGTFGSGLAGGVLGLLRGRPR